jgi:hypothetical protein
MQKVKKSPDKHIESLPEGQREDVRSLDKKISKIFTGQTRVLWEGVFWGGSEQNIIGYGDFNYKRSAKETVEWFMVGLAAQKNYISVYINAAEDGQYISKKYGDKLGKVKIGSSSVSFKKLEDVNIKELLKLVEIAKRQLKAQ